MIKWVLNKIVGNKNQREVRRLQPIVAKINANFEQFCRSADNQQSLIAKTREWQQWLHRLLPLDLPAKRIIESADSQRLQEYADVLNQRFEGLRSNFPNLPQQVTADAASIESAKSAFHAVEAQFDKLREKYLLDILPEAFALVKAGAKQMCGMELDVCGHPLKWEMVHFDVQLIGGIALHKGYIAEMATGEGKTLVATLPVFLNALTGLGVHVVTVNDYLARRDSEWMGSLFRYLGLTVGCIQSQMAPYDRREQYNCDITYGTNAEFGFDYLRDNGMASSREEQVQRGHYFAIIDEVDSILIDEARTPLIISGPAVISREGQYGQLREVIDNLVKAQNTLCNELMAEGERLFKNGEADEAGRLFYKVKLGQPRNRALLRKMQDPEYRRLLEKTELALYQDTRKRELYALKEELYYTVDEKSHDADLMEKGRNFISPDDPDAFVLPDLGTVVAEMEENPHLTHADRERIKNEMQQKLDSAGERIHATSQLLRAYTIYEKDKEYVISDNKVVIIDQNTGREMPGRRWSDGLHQAVEAKEGVEVERENQTYATITIQNYFRLYAKLAGMTGTAETEAAEFHDIYRLDVLPIPTNRECLRADKNDLIFKTRREKYNAVIAKIKEVHETGQPMLIGTASVDSSETLSRMLKMAGIKHEVLNAKNHQREAEIVSMAGQKGAVTVATNMAGRGTDIKLGAGVAELGGLCVIATERHESRRIDRQLRGRCARQGDPGSSMFYLSFEDDLMRNFGAAERMTRMMERFGVADGEALEHSLLNKSVETAQKRVEQRNYTWRKRVLDFDDVMNKQREVVYGYRNEVLTSEDPHLLVLEVINEVVPAKMREFLEVPAGEERDVDGFVEWLERSFPIDMDEHKKLFAEEELPKVQQKLLDIVISAYEKKIANDSPEQLDHLERNILLVAIDKRWQEHLYNMDALREGVHLRAQGQKDPLVEYKSEAYKLFVELMDSIKQDACQNLFASNNNLDAFEEFLRSLPQFQSGGDEDAISNLSPDALESLRGLLGGSLPQPELAESDDSGQEPYFQSTNDLGSEQANMMLGAAQDGGKKINIVKKKKPTLLIKKSEEDLDDASDVSAEAGDEQK